MIHFFRRIRQKLLSENRITRYLIYAIGEIALVMIGILLALQVNNWNENRKSTNKEIHYLKSLRADLSANQNELERVIDISSTISVKSDSLLKIALGEIKDLNTKEITKLIFAPANYSIYVNQHATVKELSQSGDLQIIRNDSIRSSIANWEAEIEEIQSYEAPSTENQKAYVDILFHNVDAYKGSLQKPIVDEKTLSELFSNRLYLNQLMLRIRRTRALARYYKRQKVKTEKLLDLVENELINTLNQDL